MPKLRVYTQEVMSTAENRGPQVPYGLAKHVNFSVSCLSMYLRCVACLGCKHNGKCLAPILD